MSTFLGPVTRRARYGSESGPYVIAHRGGAGLGPENTMQAFGLSVALGVRYLETDVRVTADGVPVAFHDQNLDRITDLSGPVRALPWTAVRRACVAGSDQSVPSMEELLGSFPGARFMVDVKEPEAISPLLSVIRRTRSAERVCLAGAWDGWLARMRENTGPHLTTALGWRSLTTLIGCFRAGVRPPRWIATARFAHVPWRLGAVPVMADPRVAARMVAIAADLDIRLMVWTVDDPADAERLLDDGVAGVISDRPDLLRPVWVRRGLWRALGDEQPFVVN